MLRFCYCFESVAKCRSSFRMNLFSRFTPLLVRNFVKMTTSARLDAVTLAEIDEGVFKYILIKVYGRVDENGQEPSKTIVR